MALRLALITGANTHPVMRNFLKKQQLATMCTMTIYMWLWLASIAVPTIPQKCGGTLHLHGSTTIISMCYIISQFTLMTLLFLSSLGELVLSPLSLSFSNLPPSINIHERAKAAKQFLGENLQTPMPSPTPKHHPKQGPIKSSKKLKATTQKWW